MKRVILISILFYKRFISPPTTLFLGGGCRFSPTCSEYAYQAIDRLGVVRGTTLAIKRLLKCQPFSRAKINHLPLAIKR